MVVRVETCTSSMAIQAWSARFCHATGVKRLYTARGGSRRRSLSQPAGGQAARRHFADTIERPVPLDRLRRYLPVDDIRTLELAYPSQQVPTWGITPGKNDVNVSTWQQIEPGDVALFVGGGQVFASGLITFKAANAELVLPEGGAAAPPSEMVGLLRVWSGRRRCRRRCRCCQRWPGSQHSALVVEPCCPPAGPPARR